MPIIEGNRTSCGGCPGFTPICTCWPAEFGGQAPPGWTWERMTLTVALPDREELERREVWGWRFGPLGAVRAQAMRGPAPAGWGVLYVEKGWRIADGARVLRDLPGTMRVAERLLPLLNDWSQAARAPADHPFRAKMKEIFDWAEREGMVLGVVVTRTPPAEETKPEEW